MPSEPSSMRSAVFNRRMLICVATGFSSGLPLFLLLNLLPAWLRSEDVDLKAIGLLTLVQIPYTWKFLWSPLVDRYRLPLGRRRGWMLFSQVGLIVAIALFGAVSPQGLASPGFAVHAGFDWAALAAFLTHPVAVIALATALCSATQDIVLDAYRREILADAELGLGNGIHITAYRIAGLVPGSLSLILADLLPWSQVFIITAAFMLPGLLMTLCIAEPAGSARWAPKTLRAAVIEPFREFLQRSGWRDAAWILAFVFFYKLGDSLCTALATPFYLDMGYSKTEIGLVAKNAGLWASVGGGLLGGFWMLRFGIARALWIFGAVQMFSILGFAWLAIVGAATEPPLGLGATLFGVDAAIALRWMKLAVVVGLEAFGVGVGTAAFVAFIASKTHPAYTATQLALLTSFMALPRTAINASAGYWVTALGWPQFYLLCFALALPGMLILLKVAPWSGDGESGNRALQ